MTQFTPLFSGSSGNASFLRFGETRLLIDAGVSCRQLEKALEMIGESVSALDAVLVTHEHDDHVKGLEQLCKKYHTPVYMAGTSFDGYSCRKPCDYLTPCVVRTSPGQVYTFGDVTVSLFATPHDSCGSLGFRFDFSDGGALGYATDMGYVTKGIAAKLFGCCTVYIESNHDVEMLRNGLYPNYLKERILSDHGHLSNAACAAFLPHLYAHGTKKIILAHLSEQNNTPRLAFEESRRSLDANGISNDDCRLTVAMKTVLA